MKDRTLIALLPGDGIGPEVTAAARRVLNAATRNSSRELRFEEGLIGGTAIDLEGDPLPPATVDLAQRAAAILLGAVGGPRWSDLAAAVRPEQGLLRLRRHFGLFANLRPVPVLEALRPLAPLRAELLEGVDILFVRELTGGLYFGPRQEQGGGDEAYDTMVYSVTEVERVAHVAFAAAQRRRRHLVSVDKANVLASMRLWRRTVDQVAKQYPDVTLEHRLVDACAMQLITRPADFDVILAGNLFGDILSDVAAVLAGSLGVLPSASLSSDRRGLYEPIHGSAPDIAGRGIANPTGAILSAALLLRYSLDREAAAQRIEAAVEATLTAGHLTADLAPEGQSSLSTEDFTDQVLSRLGS